MVNVKDVLVLRILTERGQRFWLGLHTSYVNLHKSFNSVNKDDHWRTGNDLCTFRAILFVSSTSNIFPIIPGMYQGFVLVPTLFNVCLD